MRRLICLALLALASCAERENTAHWCTVIDGDTLSCNGERLRLNGIDAPEMDTVAGWLSREHLIRATKSTRLFSWHEYKQDRYGRPVVQLLADGNDLSCLQVQSGHAEYVSKWDEEGGTARCLMN